MSRLHAVLPGLAAVATLVLGAPVRAASFDAAVCAPDRPSLVLALTAADIVLSLDWTLRWSPPHRASVTYGLG